MDRFKNQKICLILGPRRCGKTTLLKSQFPDYNYVTFDDFDALNWSKNDPKGFITQLGAEQFSMRFREIKATQNPSQRDIKNLIEFEKQLKHPVKKYLFYPGTEYNQINQVR